ncbi:MAG TPA: hypothetical protein VMV71_01620 [Candidatus Paceibacterota bacterium]|nr:hypothetical protein [Candidatus Paceibacterota bacterium]
MSNGKMRVRPATPADLKGIVEVEKESWGEGVGAGTMASPEILLERIILCNNFHPGWFWVVEVRGGIVGYLVLMPTRMSPDECKGWAMATDNGNLVGTFDPSGSFIYGASIAMVSKAPPGAMDLLVHAGHLLRLLSGKKVLYACARMPGFSRAHQKTGISADEYWQLKQSDGTPKDPFLWHFATVIGLWPVKLLENGYPPDEESGGHGVLCVNTDPAKGLLTSASRLLSVNPASSKKGGGE